ncbi:MAG: hypothetical protein JXX29_08330 [Deltaproteobacteria bacterium]|nr:hypothetical protein [Deltaproteobacteria bacterium]MBN2671667.1 hypothetical protein [Deltaproteobacteria bacterium]
MSKRAKNTTSNISMPNLFLVSISAVVLCIFVLFFILANIHWVPLYVPSLPWHTHPYSAAFETPLIVVVLFSVVLGAVGIGFMFSFVHKHNVHKQTVLKSYIVRLEAELEKTQRLITSTKHGGGHLQGETTCDEI